MSVPGHRRRKQLINTYTFTLQSFANRIARICGPVQLYMCLQSKMEILQNRSCHLVDIFVYFCRNSIFLRASVPKVQNVEMKTCFCIFLFEHFRPSGTETRTNLRFMLFLMSILMPFIILYSITYYMNQLPAGIE